jgi:CheY-like chemotaxis protein/HAMP domain-containing protein
MARSKKKYAILTNSFVNMRFRKKIWFIPIIAVIAFCLILFLSSSLGTKNKEMMTRIENNYYPAIEMNRDLTEILSNIQRGMQDAVSSQDENMLEEVDALYDSFLERIRDGKENFLLEIQEVEEIEKIFQEYYPQAKKVSKQMIKGEFTEDLTLKMQSMTAQYNEIKEKLDISTKGRKKDILDAFIVTRTNQDKFIFLNIAIALICIFLLSSVSILLIQSTTKPLDKIVTSAKELARGNIDLDIDVEGKDEIGDLAKAFSILIDTNKDLAKAAIAIGKGDYSVPVTPRSEQDALGNALSLMKANLIKSTKEIEQRNWLKSGMNEMNTQMRGIQDPYKLANNVITSLAKYLNAQIGAFYFADGDDHNYRLKLIGSYAYTRRKNISSEFKLGEGIIGQSALERQPILLTSIPDDYIRITSALGEATPRNILAVPLVYEGKVTGVIELGSLHQFKELHMKFFNEVADNIAISLHASQSRLHMKELLEKTQQQAEELQSQQEELRQINEELEEQTKSLKESEAKLQAQQEELQQANEELEEKTLELEKQKEDIRSKNIDLEHARKQLEIKAKDLEMTSKYKSEFLSNMSHELRTPLNSLLILSKLLSENKDGNLKEKQLEYINTIHDSGADLLTLINDILDLSKVEAGKVDLHLEDLNLNELLDNLNQSFKHLAKEKKLKFNKKIAEGLPEQIRTDRQRLEQVMKNFLSNAFKFTEKGNVTVSIHRPNDQTDLSQSGLIPSEVIAFAVSDTGKGISEDKQKLIFEAFQQEDGTTSRKYGGTGLGLSISREFSKLLGGEIQLESEENKGSTFTLYLPEVIQPQASEKQTEPPAELTENNELESKPEAGAPDSEQESADITTFQDNGESISPKDRSILIIEDDEKFAKILFDLAHERGFKCVVAPNGEKGLEYAKKINPSAIILDIGLPGIDGWTVMEKLKDNPYTRHIPVHFMSVSEKNIDAMKMGAIGFLNKPASMKKLKEAFKKIEDTISRTIKKLLIVEDDERQRKSILDLIGNGDVKTMSVGSGQQAFELLKSEHFDCMVLDLGLEDISGFELIEKIRKDESVFNIPIIIYTGKELTKKERFELQKHAESIIIKGAKSPERLLDETTLFLHRVEKDLPEEKQKMLRLLHDKETVFQDKKILLVDDDTRNLFALANILEEKKIKVLVAQNGKESLESLNNNPDIDLVLMDIMMPEMDGYQAIREIRKQEKFRFLPIIALTAKAMKEDRSKCIDAGANDYITKPVNTDNLFSLLRVWLYR